MATSASRSRLRCAFAFGVLLTLTVGLAWLVWFHPWKVLGLLLFAVLACPPLALGLSPGVWTRRGHGLPAAASDLPRRRPVWNVLSELYLDTELDDGDHERIAAVLVESGYSVGQIEEILYRELHPVLLGNLLSVAGEWVGFELNWLEEQILRRRAHRAPFAIIFGQWMVRRGWAALEARLLNSEI